MKSVRLIFRLLGIFMILSGLNSCKKDEDNVDDQNDCKGEDFTCTYSYSDGTSYSYRYCEDGWMAYYENGEFQYIEYDYYMSSYWDELKADWRETASFDSDLSCSF